MENNSRRYLDTVKGVAVFLMLWGHCIQYCSMGSFDCFDNGVYRGIYSFHMPLFMLVSGYLFFFSARKRDLKLLLVHRMQGLLQPIAFGTILYNFLMILAQVLLQNRIQVLFNHLFEGELFVGMYQLWFLWCVLSASMAVAVASKITQNRFLQILLMVLGIFFVAIFPNRDYHLFMYPFFVLGFLFAQYREVLKKVLGKAKYLSLVLFPVMVGFFQWRHFIYNRPELGNVYDWQAVGEIDLFRFLIGVVGSVFVMTVVELVLPLLDRMGWGRKLASAVAAIGRESLQIYCLSLPLLSGYLPHICTKLMAPFGTNLLTQNMALYNFVITPLVSAAYAAGLYFLVWLLRKGKLHNVIFGR